MYLAPRLVSVFFLALAVALGQQGRSSPQGKGPIVEDLAKSKNARFWGDPVVLRELRRRAAPKAQTKIGPNAVQKAEFSAASRERPIAPPPFPLSMPGFVTPNSQPTASIPTGIATGDFNRDGHIDWIIASGGEGTLWLYLGKGDGSSLTPTAIWPGGKYPDWVQAEPGGPVPAPTWVTAGSFRHNGILDLVVGEANTNSVAILMGNGDGTFQPARRLVADGIVSYLAIADFNGDGNNDILIARLDAGSLTVYLGDGTGNFSSPLFDHGLPSGIPPPDLTDFIEGVPGTFGIGDFDHDGILDVAYSGEGGGWVLRGIGNGQFVLQQQFYWQYTCEQHCLHYSTGSKFVDADGDGLLDYLVTDNQGIAYVYRNLGNGRFDSEPMSTFGTGDFPGDVAIVDVNRDGHPDILTCGTYPSQSYPYGAGDIPGKLLSVAYGDGAGGFSNPHVFAGGTGMIALAVADLNEDGAPDLITADQLGDTQTIFMNDGRGSFGVAQGMRVGLTVPGNSPISGSAFADLDGDARPDIVFMEEQSDFGTGIQVYVNASLNAGGGKFYDPIRTLLPGAGRVDDFVLADFRNTGRPDLVASIAGQELTNFNVFLIPNLGNGRFGSPVLIEHAQDNFQSLAAADLDHDGKVDYVISGYGALHVMKGNGDGTFIPLGSYSFNDPAVDQRQPWSCNLTLQDMNGDGIPDILLGLCNNIYPAFDHAVYEFLGKGDGTFQPARLLFHNLEAFTVADVNKDGRPDLVTEFAGTNQSGATVYLNNGDGTFAAGVSYAPYNGQPAQPSGSGIVGRLFPNGPLMGDFDGDGNLDVLVRQQVSLGGRKYFQILAGNGNGTFTPTYHVYDGLLSLPQYALDVNGDGKTDIFEQDKFTASFHYLLGTSTPAGLQSFNETGSPIQSQGTGVVILNEAVANGLTVGLSSSDSSVSVPTNLIFQGGEIEHIFSMLAGTPDPAAQIARIDASVRGSDAFFFVSPSFNLLPTLKQFPLSVLAGDPDINLTVAGYNFAPGAVANLDGVPIQTTFSNDQQLQVLIPAADLVVPGPRALTVVNPAPGGGESNRANMFVQANVTMIEQLQPASALTGAASFTLNVNGGVFTRQSVVRWNGADRTTTFLNLNNLTIQVSASDVAQAQSVAITVFDPRSGGLLSSPVTFRVIDPSPPVGAIELIGNAFNGSHTVATNALFSISGWAASPHGDQDIGISMKLNGTAFLGARTGASRPDIAAANNRPDWAHSGWSALSSSNTPGTYTISAVATDANGQQTTLPIIGGNTITVIQSTPPTGAVDSITSGDGTLTVMQNEDIFVTGWAADPTLGAPVAGVTVYFNDILHPVGSATLGVARPDIVQSTHNDAYLNSGFKYKFNVGAASIGPHYVMVQAFNPVGATAMLSLTPGGGGVLVNVVAPSVHMLPANANLGPQIVGRVSAPFVVRLSNPTATAVSLSTIAVSGDFRQTNGCPEVLNAGTKCELTVVAVPGGVGSKTGTIKVTSGPTQFVTQLSTTGVDFALTQARPSRHPRSGTNNAIRAGETATATVNLSPSTPLPFPASFSCSGAPAGASCSVSPASVAALPSELPVTLTLKTSSAPLRAIRLKRANTPESGTPAGHYVVQVHATVGGVIRSIDVPIDIQ